MPSDKVAEKMLRSLGKKEILTKLARKRLTRSCPSKNILRKKSRGILLGGTATITRNQFGTEFGEGDAIMFC